MKAELTKEELNQIADQVANIIRMSLAQDNAFVSLETEMKAHGELLAKVLINQSNLSVSQAAIDLIKKTITDSKVIRDEIHNYFMSVDVKSMKLKELYDQQRRIEHLIEELEQEEG